MLQIGSCKLNVITGNNDIPFSVTAFKAVYLKFIMFIHYLFQIQGYHVTVSLNFVFSFVTLVVIEQLCREIFFVER